MEVRRLITGSLVEHQALDERTLARVAEAKGKIVAQSSVLEYFPIESGFEGLAGMKRLREWLDKRAVLFHDPERAEQFGLTPPRGMLLLGVQGCGKSHTARAVAFSWNLPMLRLDAGRLYDKYVGATESNLRKALATADRLSPVVLWVDEIEKALASGGDADGGVSQRVLGTFLTWLQERRGNVFVVATANDISRLPPELLRKGRFDEIFFVDLPGEPVRRDILALHLAQSGRDSASFDLGRLASASAGYSGSELAQAVNAALFSAFASGGDLTTEIIEREILDTRPLSVTMRERVEALREWARDRTVPVD
jgi:SpoVK/Ycf46/Vps4 family AAA+-type ATPase